MPFRLSLLVAIALLLPAGVAPGQARAAMPNDVCGRIEDVARDFPGRLAYSLVDLDGGVTCGSRANEEFLTASLYKLFVLAAAYQERERGTLSFAESLAIRPDEAVDDPPELRAERAPQVTVVEAIRLMVQVSDNPSAAALRERLGTDVVAAMPVRLGLRDTHLGEQYTSTAADIARCFALLHAGRVVSADASREMVEVLRGEFFTAGLADGMPEGTPFAHKIGTLAGFAHDGGIVTTSNGSYVLVVMTEADESRGEVVSASAPDGGEEQRSVYDLQPAYDVMESIAAVAFSAATSRSLPPSGSFGDPDGPARDAGGAGGLGWWVGGFSALAAAAGVLALRRRGRAPVTHRPLPGRVEAPPGDAGEAAPGHVDEAADGDEPGVSAEPPGGDVGAAPADAGSVTDEVVAEPQADRNAARITGDAPYTARQDTQFAPQVLTTRRDLPMRFGSRNNHNDDAERAERVEMRQELRAPRPAPQRAQLPPVTSARLRRIAEYFVAQEELLHEMQRQVEMETAPLAELLVRQQTTMQQTMANLEDRLRPMNEYADAEEANLAALEQRMAGAGMDFVARSFAEYLATQRERIAETRGHIDEQRTPFLRYDEDARGVVEVALSRFDDDLGALEQNLSEQRRVMLRMLDAMRSESFASAKELLLSREALMEEMARTGVTDPGEISSRLHSLRSDVSADGGNAHVQQVIAATDSADQRLNALNTGRPRPVANRAPAPEVAEPPAAAEAGEATTA